MSRTFLLIWKPESSWRRIVQVQHSLLFVFAGYLLPILLIASIGEGFGMIWWRKWYVGTEGLIRFTLGQAMVFEAMHMALTLIIIIICASIIRILGDPFYSRYSYRQALTMVIYSTSPLFLFQLLVAVPWVNIWIPWAMGIFFSLKVLYYGMPRMLESAPGHALGLYLVTCTFMTALTGAEWYMFVQCLTGKGVPINNVIFNIAAQLPL